MSITEKEKRVIKNLPPQEVINKIREELSAPAFPYKNIGLGKIPPQRRKLNMKFIKLSPVIKERII